MKKILVCLAILLLVNAFFARVEVKADFQTSAKAMCLIEKTTGREICSKNEEEKLPMASTTKIVTALTVLENCDNLDEKFKVDDRAVGVPGTSIYLIKGEELTVRELLYGMMLVSGNDAATALALHISNSIEEFCNLMQETALKAGATNSSFSNPHGLDEEGHYTTAHDLALIAAKALQNPTFAEIVSTRDCKISGNEKNSIRYLKNKNKLLNTFQGATGVKTGFTDDAGRCFVGSAEREGTEFVCVLFNCGPMFEECSSLIEEAFKNYSLIEIVPSYNYISKVGVIDGREEDVKVYSRKGFSYPLSEDEKNRIVYEYNIPENITAPIEKDSVVGNFNIYLDGKLLFSENVYAMEEIKSVNFLENLKEIIKNWNSNFLDIA
ncbi:MAG TPA: D-alanyl-D-alanine carboxypeptidase [Candidatus Caccopulliclostridium gallistercoris]|uniref:serine-type D-Ala-D-Ala carboxypeptidase n=1 Tax=Candidatus Caccopulliclostridium gallistercoris TaxID=2840719 RepID=A0A9D1NFH7_9FIRM|nr:D-alanyl-D-alanine carboxypeptidase [Candidatus Caccopulliclostridium gallistercoris]